jgi:filamentous hemagglutinin
LLKLTPPGLVAGTGVGTYELTRGILQNGLTETALQIAQGIAGLPTDLKERLNSSDPAVRGEALVDALSLGVGAAVVSAKLTTIGYDVLKAGAASALDQAALNTLIKTGGVIDRNTGLPVLNMSELTIAQKARIGELFGEGTVKQIVPDGTKVGRAPLPGQSGIDDLYKVNRPDVDYVVIEYKFDQSKLGSTLDGKQMSDSWLEGTSTGYNRILESVGDANKALANDVTNALNAGRMEKWVVRTLPDGSTQIRVLDALGNVKGVGTSGIMPTPNALGVIP